ncbi:MAG: hypothetical protein IIX14_02295 [Clostridia bacterium]|nr:hypothetical protein [Clostridia bacterium]
MKAKKKNNFNIKAVAIILAIILLCLYLIYQFVLFSKAEMETQPALRETVYTSIDTKAFVVRDEKFITNNASGTKVSFAADGERVASGDTVSIVFDSSDAASSFLKINELEKRIKHFEELSGQANFQAVNINSLNAKINGELTDFLEDRDNGHFRSAVASAEGFRDSVTGKQIATGTALDFSKQLADLKNELAALKNVKYSYTQVKSEVAGYYINGADGYESTIDFAKINELDVKDVETALASQPQSVSQNIVGRVVGSFEWYIVCAVPTDDTVNLSADKELYVNIPNEGIEKLPVSLYKIGERTGDKTLLILSCNIMNESLADLRIEEIQLVTQEYSGYKISNSAIRTVDGVKGVYIIRGNLLGFRKIHIVYSNDTFSIVDNPEGETDYIKQYDEVVTKGVELYDNKLV